MSAPNARQSVRPRPRPLAERISSAKNAARTVLTRTNGAYEGDHDGHHPKRLGLGNGSGVKTGVGRCGDDRTIPPA